MYHDTLVPSIDWGTLQNFFDLIAREITPADALLILTLTDDPQTLDVVWQAIDMTDKVLFAEVVEALVDGISWCNDCCDVVWSDETYYTYGDSSVCQDCRDENYSSCSRCDQLFPDDEVTNVDGDTYCDRRCLGNYCNWCDDCDTYYYQDDHDHDHDEPNCECDAPRTRFTFPANGHGTITQNERLTVELPAGTISLEGMDLVSAAIYRSGLHRNIHDIKKVVDGLDPEWQKKQGNFTRRLSKAIWQQLALKVPPALMSEIGNIARQNTSNVSDYRVEFTRDLNDSAGSFYHEESCWWQSYSASRCALKSWGGLGLRSYRTDDEARYCPDGRAWIQPLDERLNPTHNTTDAHAYLIYNGYGALEGYAPARIVAHLTGMTYRKVEVNLDPVYVNNSNGYLIADEVTCAATDSIRIYADQHEQFDARSLSTTRQEVAA